MTPINLLLMVASNLTNLAGNKELDLIRVTDRGLYCAAGDFYIDPWRPVERAIITHGHSDHARQGSRRYLCHNDSLAILRLRLGEEADLSGVAYNETLNFDGVKVSLHPAGHILGSAQIRVEHQGLVTVVSGDYKTQSDPTCPPLTPVKCDVFISESTFGLPVYQFPEPARVMAEIDSWWRANKEAGKVSIVYAYSLGKAQRIAAGVDDQIGPIYTHGAVEALNTVYRGAGVKLPATAYVGETTMTKGQWSKSGALIIAPPNAQGSAWVRRFGPVSEAFASGWMAIRGARRRRALDRGFILSDHADWNGLISVIKNTCAQRVLLTHGYTPPLMRFLNENGVSADTLETTYGVEEDTEVQPLVNEQSPETEALPEQSPEAEGLQEQSPEEESRGDQCKSAEGEAR
jgi:putative mRNA 3-end processing factor